MERETRRVGLLIFVSICSLLITHSLEAGSVEGGRFGRGLRVEKGGEDFAAAEGNPVYFVTPMTVELWAKIEALEGRAVDVVLISNEPTHSNTHWEMRAKSGGGLVASFSGYEPKEVAGDVNIVDGKWHYLAMIFDGKTLSLWADGKQVASKAVQRHGPYPDTGPLNFGHLSGKNIASVDLDEVRISRVVRDVSRAPEAPFTADADTMGLWHFDEDQRAYDRTGFADASATHNPARLKLLSDDLGNGGFDGTVGPRTRWADMDCGRFFSSTLGSPLPKGNITYKAISIRLGQGKDTEKKAAIAFDTELLRYSVAWTGNFVRIYNGREGLAQHPDVAGSAVFATTPGPGWAKGNDWADPRPDKLGPLPADWAKYKGLYVNGDRVILSYTVGGTQVLESPGIEDAGGNAVFSRTFYIAPASGEMLVRLCDANGEALSYEGLVGTSEAERVTVAGVVGAGAPGGVKVEMADHGVGKVGAILLRVGAHASAIKFRALIYAGSRDGLKAAAEELKGPAAADLSTLVAGGPARYPEAIVTKGDVGKDTTAYVVDTLTAPTDNPWKSFLRFSGHDFFSNGDLAVCSISGDVWVVSGIDATLQNLKWRRFATGLFQPLGLKVVEDKVCVIGRDQITRLHDLNGDGEADFYENVNNDCKVTENGHAYTTCLETDPDGNFYYAKCADGTAHGGTVMKVSKYGETAEVFATGIRNCNGLGMGPGGELTEADNEGEWVPASRIDFVKKGTFLGFRPTSHTPAPPDGPGTPICYMPQNCDNSCGGQTWVIGDKWGPLAGEMLHTSYGKASLYHVMYEKVGDVAQGGVYQFPFRFASGAMRGPFSPVDGQLYVSGLRGWQTAGSKDGALQRVRYTGKSANMPAALHVHKNGVRITFTDALDPKSAADADSYGVLEWNYHWTGGYGSAHWSVKDPQKQGHDVLAVKSAHLSADRKTVFLEIPDIQPVMQMQITWNLDAADGAHIRQSVWNTIHVLGPALVAEAFETGGDRQATAAPATGPATRAADVKGKTKKIVLIAGKKSHGPGEHEYEKGCRLLKACLDSSPNVKSVETTVVTDGWPADEKILEEADAIFMFCDGSDQDEERHPLLKDDRLKKLGASWSVEWGWRFCTTRCSCPRRKAAGIFRTGWGRTLTMTARGRAPGARMISGIRRWERPRPLPRC